MSRSEVDCTRYGTNRKSVSDAIAEVEGKMRQVDSYGTTVTAVEEASDNIDPGHVEEVYDGLKESLEKKLGCLKTLLELTDLEESCGTMSAEFDAKAVHLVSVGGQAEGAALMSSDRIGGFGSPSSRDCIFATRDNWDWILTLVDCAKVHLTNAAEYHQFFHEIDESVPCLLDDLQRVALTFDVTKFKGDYEDAKRLLKELEDMTRILRQWDAKTQRMWERACQVVPVHLRVEGIRVETPCRSLADYKTKEIDMRRGEDLLLLDNTRTSVWVVRTARGEEAEVPAPCILIPGPTDAALHVASRLRLQLLAAWTNVMKRIGKRLLCFMLLVFKPVYEDEEIDLLRATRNIQKADLLRILDYIEASLRTHWSEHEAFIALQERVLALRMILEESSDNPNEGEGVHMSLVVQVTMLEELMKKYRDLWTQWEQMKVAVEASRLPELMLIVDKWEQLQFVSRGHMAKFWQTELRFDEMERSMASLQSMVADGVDGVDGGDDLHGSTLNQLHGSSSFGYGESVETPTMIEEMVQQTSATNLASAKSAIHESEFGMAHETITAETEQLLSAKMEEKKTFFITAVVDPRTDREVSMDDAVIAGIIKPGEGIYFNQLTSQSMPIPEAMSAGLIKVSFTTTKRSQEKKSTIGIITVKTTRVSAKPYTIKSVKDLATNKVLTQEESCTKGLIDMKRGVFTDTKTKTEMLIAEAIEAGFIIVEYEDDGTAPPAEAITKTYAVRGVVDRSEKKIITFQEAVQRGIICKQTGAYRDTMTGNTMEVGNAIMRGFLKARQIDGSEGLNIDPENRLVIDKTNVIRKKLLQPLGVISAFRRAAKIMTLGKDNK